MCARVYASLTDGIMVSVVHTAGEAVAPQRRFLWPSLCSSTPFEQFWCSVWGAVLCAPLQASIVVGLAVRGLPTLVHLSCHSEAGVKQQEPFVRSKL